LKIEMKRRYGLGDDVVDDLEPFLMEYLMSERIDLDGVLNNWHLALKKLDNFIEKEEFYFLSKDIKVGRPYQKFLDNLPEIMEGLENGDIGIKASVRGLEHGNRLQRLGDISVPDDRGTVYTLYLYVPEIPKSERIETESIVGDLRKKNRVNSVPPKKVYLVASKWDVRSKPKIADVLNAEVTSQDGVVAAEAFLSAQKQFDVRKLSDLSGDFEGLAHGVVNSDNNFSVAPDNYRLTMLPRYKDFMGRFDYELAFLDEYENNVLKNRYLVARTPGDENFTTFRACEAAQYYVEGAYIMRGLDDNRDKERAKADCSKCSYLKSGAISWNDRSLNSRQSSAIARSNSQAKGRQHRTQRRG
jgi:hypothetical protein